MYADEYHIYPVENLSKHSSKNPKENASIPIIVKIHNFWI